MLSSLVRIVALLVLCVMAIGATAQSVPDWARPADITVGPDPPGPPDSPHGPHPHCPPGVPNPNACSGNPHPVPIDGGLSLLALAGGAYAVRRLRKNREEGDESDE